MSIIHPHTTDRTIFLVYFITNLSQTQEIFCQVQLISLCTFKNLIILKRSPEAKPKIKIVTKPKRVTFVEGRYCAPKQLQSQESEVLQAFTHESCQQLV